MRGHRSLSAQAVAAHAVDEQPQLQDAGREHAPRLHDAGERLVPQAQAQGDEASPPSW